LQSAFYGHRILCFWALVLVNLGTLQQVAVYFEKIRKIHAHSSQGISAIIRFLRHTSLAWGICLFGVWTIALLALSRIPSLPFSDVRFPIINLFGFYLIALVLLEVYVLYRHLQISVKIFLIFVALVIILLPVVLFRFLENEQIYLHSVIGYMANLITPFLVRGGNASMQWRVFLINLLICALPLLLIFSKYRGFFKLRNNM
jgi:hypothetical protein